MTGLFVGMVLMLLKVDLALVFGLLAFLLNFVPNGSAVPLVVCAWRDRSYTPSISSSSSSPYCVLARALPSLLPMLTTSSP